MIAGLELFYAEHDVEVLALVLHVNDVHVAFDGFRDALFG